MAEMELDLDRAEQRIKINDKKQNKVRTFIIREMDGAGRDRHTVKLRQIFDYDDNGEVTGLKPGIDQDDGGTALLTESLWEEKAIQNGESSFIKETQFTAEQIKSFGWQFRRKLVNIATELNGFGPEAEQKIKNDSAPSENSGTNSHENGACPSNDVNGNSLPVSLQNGSSGDNVETSVSSNDVRS